MPILQWKVPANRRMTRVAQRQTCIGNWSPGLPLTSLLQRRHRNHKKKSLQIYGFAYDDTKQAVEEMEKAVSKLGLNEPFIRPSVEKCPDDEELWPLYATVSR
jgi:hypothetical protein